MIKALGKFIFIFTGLVIFSVYLLNFLFSEFTDLGLVVEWKIDPYFTSVSATLIILYLLGIFILSCITYWLFKRINWFTKGIILIWVLAIIFLIAVLRKNGLFHSIGEFFVLFMLLSVPPFIIGLIRPTWILKFMDTKYQTRRYSSLFFGGVFIGSFILFSIFGTDIQRKSVYQVYPGTILTSALSDATNSDGWISGGDFGEIKSIKPEELKTVLYGQDQWAIKLKSSNEKTFSMISRRVAVPKNAELFSFCFYFPNKGDGDWLTVHFEKELALSFSGEDGELWNSANGDYESSMLSSDIPIRQYQGEEHTIYIMLNGSGPESSGAVLTEFSFLSAGDISLRNPNTYEPKCWTRKRSAG